MTVTDWIRENYAEHGRKYVINGIEECREVTGHSSSASTWDRLVRRVIREMEGSGPEPENSFQIRTIEDALSYHDVPEHLFDIARAKVNSWGSADNANQQVSIELKPKKEEFSVELWAKAFRQAVEDIDKNKFEAHVPKDPNLVHLVSIPDMHFGKIASASRIGGQSEDYNPEIAHDLFVDAVRYLSQSIDPETTKEIVFDVSQDLLNVDNLQLSTTALTPQDNSDPYEMIQFALSALFSTIEYLAEKANIIVPVVGGNHDRYSSYFLSIILQEHFANDDRVTIDVSPVRDWVYDDGDNYMFCLIHGDKVKKPSDLVLRFASRYPETWRNKYRYIFSGHFHKTESSDVSGTLVELLPTLSAGATWEDLQNYSSLRMANLHTFADGKGRIATSYFSPGYDLHDNPIED